MSSTDDIVKILKCDAIGYADFFAEDHDPVEYGWSITHRSEVIRVEAIIRQASADPNEAWRFFTALRDALLGAGFTLAFNCRLGVTPAEGTSPDAAPQGGHRDTPEMGNGLPGPPVIVRFRMVGSVPVTLRWAGWVAGGFDRADCVSAVPADDLVAGAGGGVHTDRG